jgi:enamine deaminase RidA (YjgF/YER057c/UK114 family)
MPGSAPSERLRNLGLVLPPAPPPAGSYAPAVVVRDRAWVSGQIALREGKPMHPGLVDREVTPDQAREAARQATLQALSALGSALGSVDQIQRVVRVSVFVASVPTFTRQHEVADAATELLIALFGESGRPARISIGVSALPLGAPVEVALEVQTA